MYKIGLVGYGAFGKILTQWLAPYAEFEIYDRDMYPDSLQKTLSQSIIILAIPAQFLNEFLTTNKESLNPNALYIDVCSVKVEPVNIMTARLPETAQIVATHPMFGPESAKHGVAGQKMMIYPVRTQPETYQAFTTFLRGLELKLIETTPEAHDRDMAYIQGLSHYIGRIMQELDIPDTDLSTQAYRDLLDMKNVQGNDSDDLFSSIVHNNPYAAEVLARFKEAIEVVDKQFDL